MVPLSLPVSHHNNLSSNHDHEKTNNDCCNNENDDLYRSDITTSCPTRNSNDNNVSKTKSRISHHLSNYQGIDFGSHTLLPHSPRVWRVPTRKTPCFNSYDISKNKSNNGIDNNNENNCNTNNEQRQQITICIPTHQQQQRTQKNNKTTTTTTTTRALLTKQNSKRKQKQVRFSTCEIREYAVILGDHPCCREGVALTLDWSYNQDDCTVLDATLYGFWQDGSPTKLNLPERKERLAIVSDMTESEIHLLELEREEQFEIEWIAMLEREYKEIMESGPGCTAAAHSSAVKHVSTCHDLKQCTTAQSA